jgi:hypothetical protein
MTTSHKADRGKGLLAFGILWFISSFLRFVLDSFWPPLGIFTLPQLNHPQSIYNIFLRAEFVMPATLAAVGMLVWRSAFGKHSLADYIIVLSCASVPALCVFKMSEWIHFSN